MGGGRTSTSANFQRLAVSRWATAGQTCHENASQIPPSVRGKLRISRSSREGSQTSAASSLGWQFSGNETISRDRSAILSVIRKDMVQAKHITAVAAVLIAAYLSGCGYATLNFDTTASVNSSASSTIKRAPPATPSASTDRLSTTPDKTSAAALNSTTEAAATPIGSPPNAAEKVIEPRGRAYLFRGVAGLIYSARHGSIGISDQSHGRNSER